jgi:UDP-glucose 4-epimerase
VQVDGKHILVTGGTGSLGNAVVERLLSGRVGVPAKVTVFSRDEAKQHAMRVRFEQRANATEDVMYRNWERTLQFRIGDVRDYHSVREAVRDVQIVLNIAALKHVPACEYFPYEAVLTNIIGPQQIVRAIRENDIPVEVVVGISTDKACGPVNVMGMTKAIQERIFMNANLDCKTRFCCVRYGNVIGSRGSIVPLFAEQIRNGGPVTVTHTDMTRFLVTINEAVDVVLYAMAHANAGETIVPKIGSARVVDIAKVMIGSDPIPMTVTGIRPGEKLHEVLVSRDETIRTVDSGEYYAIQPVLPELQPKNRAQQWMEGEYCSQDATMPLEALKEQIDGVC